MTYEEAQAELSQMLKEAEAGPYVSAREAFERLHAKLDPKNFIFITGDPHAQFGYIRKEADRQKFTSDTTCIILGDVGVNYYGDERDLQTKKDLSSIPGTFFCLHGNHENRPQNIKSYHEIEYRGGKCLVEDAFPNLIFPIDGEVFDFHGHSVLVIGGAYSVDKFYRLRNGWNWFEDEQPSAEIKRRVERVLEARNWKVDIVLSHTCPLKYEPVEVFISGIDQSKVDKSTELWLDSIEDKLTYERWYCGHYHTDKKIDKLEFLFHGFTLLPKEHLNIQEEADWAHSLEAKWAHEAEIMETLERGSDTAATECK